MRRPIFCTILLLMFCCLAALRANAQQTYEYSDISYDDSTGTVYGYSATDIDYSCSENYDAYVEGYLKNQNGTTLDSGYATHPYLAQVYTSASGDPDAVYSEAGYHDVIAHYYYDDISKSPDGCMPCDGCNTDCYWYQEDYYWWDPYGFSTSGHTGQYGSWVSFFRDGPYVQVENDEYIDLGQTSASASAPSPDHLKILSDLTDEWCTGGQTAISLRRVITYQVVDVNNNPISRQLSVGERFFSLDLHTCGAGPPNQSSCGIRLNGQFSDELMAGCTPTGGSCGYEVLNQIVYCRSLSVPKPLGSLNESVHADQITVNGNSTNYSPGTYIYP